MFICLHECVLTIRQFRMQLTHNVWKKVKIIQQTILSSYSALGCYLLKQYHFFPVAHFLYHFLLSVLVFPLFFVNACAIFLH